MLFTGGERGNRIVGGENIFRFTAEGESSIITYDI